MLMELQLPDGPEDTKFTAVDSEDVDFISPSPSWADGPEDLTFVQMKDGTTYHAHFITFE
ncbi:hypothetical protein [Salinibacter phage M8CC-19]|uniref:Uncharacterized protein n=2 Tax=Kryptosalinivirus M8CC19 TaxID=2560720 RepID=A0A2I6UGD7_9CAUD|nr:hypothetical protein FGG63_gp56 [Salinibacter phage M8CC-19]AUO79021.1 hypothetical protein [Salinibacter phage M8CC-19]AUO79254.1 hypothetical protein [Salinibacter phage M31CC-1]